MNILEFSDDVLCMICTYIDNGEDKIAVSKTCCRFHNLMQDRKLVRRNNFSRAYHLSIVDIGTFILAGRDYVVELNLTSCCFLKSSDILSLALKLSNLKHFYVADTKILLKHLFSLLEKKQQITKLSLTWKEGRDLKKEFDFSTCTTSLEKIESLFVYVKPGDRHANLSRLVRPCTALRELRIIALTCVHTKDYFPQAPEHLRSLAVSCRVCCCYASVEVAEEVKILAGYANEWDYFIFDFRGSDVFAMKPVRPSQYVPNTLLENLDNMKHARAVCFPDNVAKISLKTAPCKNLRLASANLFNASDDSSLLDDGYPMLQQLRIFSETQLKLCHGLSLPLLKEVRAVRESPELRCPDFSYIKHWPHLTKLCVSSCILKPSSSTERNILTVSNLRQPFKPKKRCVAETNHGSLLRDFVNSSPDLQELNIRGCNICIGASSDSDSPRPVQADSILKSVQADGELMYVAYWHNLERLDLSQVPIRTGAFLVQVSESCPKLHSLYLSSLGLTGMCTYMASLVKALPNCKNLKDFRLYQNCIGDVATLFTALKHCSKLERLAIICPTNPDHKVKKEIVINFVRQAKNLKFLFLCFEYATLGVNEGYDLQMILNSMRESRKLLVTEIHSYCSSDPTSSIDSEQSFTLYVLNNFRFFDNLPGFHLAEMIFHHHTVSSIPLFWETYDVFR